MPRKLRSTFLPTEEEDEALEASNQVFWSALIGHIRADGFDRPPVTVLDVGSHRGGLLERIAHLWGSKHLVGIEPVAALRKRAQLRLQRQADSVKMLAPSQWSQVHASSIDLLIAFECLQLLEDLPAFFDHVGRVLADGGRAYIALGCHAENPVWPDWRGQLERIGHRVFTHHPMELLREGAERGLLPSVRPLRRDGWITHDPRDPTFTFASATAMLDHHYRHKLLFRFIRE